MFKNTALMGETPSLYYASAKYPGEAKGKKLVGKYYYRLTEDESYPDVALRIHSFLGTLTRDFPCRSVLAVCHSVIVLVVPTLTGTLERARITSFWFTEVIEESMEQKWPSSLVILRHGQSARNVAKDVAKAEGKHSFDLGLRDLETPLTKHGHLQGLETGRYLSSRYKFDVIYSSPYHRALQTAEDITSTILSPPPLVIEERIREIEFGILDGLTAEGIRKQFPQEADRRKREGKYWYRPPGGESRPDVALRVQSFLGTLTRDYCKMSVLTVCHSVVVLVFRRLLERWNEDEYRKIDRTQDVENCSITAYRCDAKTGKLLLDCYNGVSHLGG